MDSKPGFTEILERHSGERHVIVLHEYPDPDAISCAYTHQLISSRFGIDCDIIYCGKISHRQNVALVKLLGIEMIQYDESCNLGQYQAAVFLDHQGTTVEEIVAHLEDAGVPILILVDHHEAQDRIKGQFTDIRPVGATATLFAEYLEAGALEMDRSRKDHVAAATALMHGLLTDTGSFIRAGVEDFRAAAFLSQYRDIDMLSQIMSQARSKQVMELIRRALGNRVVMENFSVAGIGYLRSEDRDAIPQAAEFLLSEENAHTAIVYGIVRDSDNSEMLIGSMRTSKITIDPDEFIKEVFGKTQEGRYYGGGKLTAGAFSIPIGFLVGDHNPAFQDMKWQVYDAQVKYKILVKLGLDHDTIENLIHPG